MQGICRDSELRRFLGKGYRQRIHDIHWILNEKMFQKEDKRLLDFNFFCLNLFSIDGCFSSKHVCVLCACSAWEARREGVDSLPDWSYR